MKRTPNRTQPAVNTPTMSHRDVEIGRRIPSLIWIAVRKDAQVKPTSTHVTAIFHSGQLTEERIRVDADDDAHSPTAEDLSRRRDIRMSTVNGIQLGQMP